MGLLAKATACIHGMYVLTVSAMYTLVIHLRPAAPAESVWLDAQGCSVVWGTAARSHTAANDAPDSVRVSAWLTLSRLFSSTTMCA